MQLPGLLEKPNVHEQKLHGIFRPSQLCFTGSEPEFDVPLVLLGFYNRSGSNLLGSYLKDLPGFSGFGEHLNWTVIENRKKRKALGSFPDFFRDAQGTRSAQHCHGFKASWGQVLMLKRFGIDRMYQGMKLVHIVRHDLVGQAISLVIARQTSQWTSEQTGTGAKYDAKQISTAIQACCEADMRMKLVIDILGINTLQVSYEDLTTMPETVMRQIGVFLGRDLSGWKPGETGLRKQASQLNEQWRARYLQDAGELLIAAEPGRRTRAV